MYRILFVCYGNICRSPMAEMIFKDMVIQQNKKFLFFCESKATSMEEYGNPIYPKAKETLERHGVVVERHVARMVKKEDYEQYDYILCMDQNNYDSLLRIFGGDPLHKIQFLLSFTDSKQKEIEDPWYTDRFEKVYQMIEKGCRGLLQTLVDAYQNEANQ